MRDCTHPLLPTRQLVGLVLLIILCFSISTVGESVAARHIPTWYREVTKPGWYPPRWVFAPMWSAYYLAMAVAAWLVWRCGGASRNRWPLAFFATHLLLNLTWSLLFFGMENPRAAFAASVMWWLAGAATTYRFAPLSRWAGILMAGCLAWATFICSLTYAIWTLNN